MYIIAGGGFTMSGNAKATGTGVTIYNAGSNYATGASGGTFGAISLSGNATLTLTTPTTGADAGVVFFQARDNTQAVDLSGNCILNLSGAFYIPQATMNISGNANLKQSTVIVGKLTMTGNGKIS